LTGPSGREDLHPKEVRSPSQNGRQKRKKKRKKKEKKKKKKRKEKRKGSSEREGKPRERGLLTKGAKEAVRVEAKKLAKLNGPEGTWSESLPSVIRRNSRAGRFRDPNKQSDAVGRTKRGASCLRASTRREPSCRKTKLGTGCSCVTL
jgi:hypothetical protein